jgi:hypothetical protein
MLHNPQTQLCASDYTVPTRTWTFSNYTAKSGKFILFKNSSLKRKSEVRNRDTNVHNTR